MPANGPAPIFTLPLFPLHHVQFPQIPLQLHVFEERYKAMINACIERDEPFGVVLIREGTEVGPPATPFDIGCIARILAVKRLDDGRIYLLAAGEGRFRLLDYMEADLPYLLGKVETLEDETRHGSASVSLIATLQETFTRYLALLSEQAGVPLPTIELPDEPQPLAFCIAAVANLPQVVKQDLLEMTDPQARLLEELRLLNEQITQLETLREAEPDTDNEPDVLIAAPLEITDAIRRDYLHEGRN